LTGYQEDKMAKIASSVIVALGVASTLPAWAQTHALDGSVYFSDPQVTAVAIDPNGPAPGVAQSARPFAHLSNGLCFRPDFCQQQHADHGPDDPTPLALNTSLSYLNSWTTAQAQEPGLTSLAAHIERFSEGVQRDTMSADAVYSVPNFDVAPNTLATFTIRLHGALSAASDAFPDLGEVVGEAQFVPSDPLQWQPTHFSLQLSTAAQSFDRLIVATLRNDTAETENVSWYLHSALDLQLLPAVPEPTAWLMLLAGLALLLSTPPARAASRYAWPVKEERS
jgi:hypothetical protein